MPQVPTAVSEPPAAPLREFPSTFGDLALLKPLGRGDLGDVFVALRPEGADRLCVVNLLMAEAVDDAALIERLRAQASWLVARVHGNLAQIYDVGQAAGRLFFVTEWVEGRDLGGILTASASRPGGFPIDVASFVGLEMAAALDFVRGSEERTTGVATSLVGFAPGAVLLSREGGVKIVHYGSGVIRAPDGLKNDLARLSLIAPELAQGAAGSARTDVFAAGGLLWQMLVGRPLAENGDAHWEAIHSGKFQVVAPSVAAPNRHIPPELDRVVAAALSTKPEHRPESCQALRAELGAVVKALGVDGPTAVKALVEETFGSTLGEELTALNDLARSAERKLVGPRPHAPTTTLTNFEDPGSRQERVREAEDHFALGEVIPGTRYRALQKLGEGGMGTVYAAEHVDIERKVALKIVHRELLENPIVLRQFRQEARAASRIKNPYICDVTDWGELSDGRVFFVMEFLGGPSLGRVLKEKRRLTGTRAIPILRQVAKALGSAHEKSIVHLDVKPDNVLLIQKDGRADSVKVVDFGVAGILGQVTGATRVMGTPEYMAPERVTGRGYDHRSDVYSLGVMAFEMLVGEVPFQGDSAIQTLAMHAADPPDRINERVTTPVPDALEAVVSRMMAKDPAVRPQSMAEVEAQLCEAQIEAGIRTAWDDLPLPPLSPERAARIKRKLSSGGWRARVFPAASIGAAALSVGLAVYMYMRPPVTVPAFAPVAAPVITTPPPAQVVKGPADPPPPARPVIAEAPSPAPRPAVSSSRRRPSEDTEPARSRDPVLIKEAVGRGMSLLARGRYDQAVGAFDSALAEDASHVEALVGKAEALWEQSKYSEALAHCLAGIKRAPRAARLHQMAGDLYARGYKFDVALKSYERARVLNPKLDGIDGSIDGVKKRLGDLAP